MQITIYPVKFIGEILTSYTKGEKLKLKIANTALVPHASFKFLLF